MNRMICLLTSQISLVLTALTHGGMARLSVNHLTATGNHMRSGIAQCYLPPTSGDFPILTPAEVGTRFSDPG